MLPLVNLQKKSGRHFSDRRKLVFILEPYLDILQKDDHAFRRPPFGLITSYYVSHSFARRNFSQIKVQKNNALYAFCTKGIE